MITTTIFPPTKPTSSEAWIVSFVNCPEIDSKYLRTVLDIILEIPFTLWIETKLISMK